MKELFEIEKYKSNKPVINSGKAYKNYMTIRRDLRCAHSIVERNISLKESINNGSVSLEDVGDTMYIERSALMHAVTLYSRWFKATSGKPTLDTKVFFAKGSSLERSHKEIIDLRDKYLAHNELDLLGTDRVWVNFDEHGNAESVYSDFIENQFINHNELELNQFKDCIELVHNKIDAEIIPDKEAKLLEMLRKA
ncbi:TPA: hypothetical protein RQJ73_004311 [Vibrio vulnificus]|nr:hypothetical protein [Vibrio vulnificus]HDY7630968.1 hypothetical protein [Vibrio vulnificus]